MNNSKLALSNYITAEQLQTQHPENFRIWDAEVLASSAGVREVLTFAGIPASDQVIVLGQRPSDANGSTVHASIPMQPVNSSRTEPRKCAVLVPAYGPIHPDCEASLKVLEQRDYPVRRVKGYAAIDQARNQMATDALREGFDETLWIDSDIGFDPDAIECLRSHNLPIVCGIYPKKGQPALACHVLPGTKSVTFGEGGGLIELMYAATGFLLVRREVYLRIHRHFNLPVCNERFARPLIAFFQPIVRTIDDGYWYLAEDYSFCHRAREAGLQIMADTSIRLWHIGEGCFGWEDAAGQTQRQASFTLNLEKSTESDSSSLSSLPRKERADVAQRLAGVV